MVLNRIIGGLKAGLTSCAKQLLKILFTTLWISGACLAVALMFRPFSWAKELFDLTGWIVPLLVVVILVYVRLGALPGALISSFRTMLFNSIIALSMVLITAMAIPHLPIDIEHSLDWWNEGAETLYSWLKLLTTIGWLGSISLIFLFSLLQYQTRRAVLQGYTRVLDVISTVSFILAILTTFVLAEYVPTGGIANRLKSVATEKYERIESSLVQIELKKASIEKLQSLKTNEIHELVKNINTAAENVLSHPPSESDARDMAASSELSALANITPVKTPPVRDIRESGANTKLPESPGNDHLQTKPPGTQERPPIPRSDELSLNHTWGECAGMKTVDTLDSAGPAGHNDEPKPDWYLRLKSYDDQRMELVKHSSEPNEKLHLRSLVNTIEQDKSALNSEESTVSASMELLKQTVSALVPESSKDIANEIIDGMVDGITEELYSRYAESGDVKFNKLLAFAASKINSVIPSVNLEVSPLFSRGATLDFWTAEAKPKDEQKEFEELIKRAKEERLPEPEPESLWERLLRVSEHR